ncbi:sigma-70 family RNA polymerase sigma factor [Nakamurella flava]|uniref:sigma-70 family RNA polymerase sigma factor n=1 Tax=Nakamurella flava TaxID=2576308 RepID=UPI00140D660C|nr:sigma-70 family RNA polymerase sigma factor [Nakamurella flava]
MSSSEEWHGELADVVSDPELITQVRGGDRSAFGELYRRHSSAATTLARQFARSPAEADDLVSEAFARVLDQLLTGHGPDTAFRAYLFTSLRNTAYDRTRKDRRLQFTDDMTGHDQAVAGDDPVVAQVENGLVATAFARLPERWQAVLWHTQVEGESPAAVGALLGMAPGAVSSLAFRAREGLREAYLQAHLADTAGESCRTTVERLGAWTRNGLSRREKTQVDAHLAGCERCRALGAELQEVNTGLRALLAPVLLGAAAAGYLASLGPIAPLAAGLFGVAPAGAALAGSGSGVAGSAATAGVAGSAGTAGAAGVAGATGTAGTVSSLGAVGSASGVGTVGAATAGASTAAATGAGSAVGLTAGAAHLVGATGVVATGTVAGVGAGAGVAAAGVGAAGLGVGAAGLGAVGVGAAGVGAVVGGAAVAGASAAATGLLAVGTAAAAAAVTGSVIALSNVAPAPQIEAGAAPANTIVVESSVNNQAIGPDATSTTIADPTAHTPASTAPLDPVVDTSTSTTPTAAPVTDATPVSTSEQFSLLPTGIGLPSVPADGTGGTGSGIDLSLGAPSVPVVTPPGTTTPVPATSIEVPSTTSAPSVTSTAPTPTAPSSPAPQPVGPPVDPTPTPTPAPDATPTPTPTPDPPTTAPTPTPAESGTSAPASDTSTETPDPGPAATTTVAPTSSEDPPPDPDQPPGDTGTPAPTASSQTSATTSASPSSTATVPPTTDPSQTPPPSTSEPAPTTSTDPAPTDNPPVPTDEPPLPVLPVVVVPPTPQPVVAGAAAQVAIEMVGPGEPTGATTASTALVTAPEGVSLRDIRVALLLPAEPSDPADRVAAADETTTVACADPHQCSVTLPAIPVQGRLALEATLDVAPDAHTESALTVAIGDRPVSVPLSVASGIAEVRLTGPSEIPAGGAAAVDVVAVPAAGVSRPGGLVVVSDSDDVTFPVVPDGCIAESDRRLLCSGEITALRILVGSGQPPGPLPLLFLDTAGRAVPVTCTVHPVVVSTPAAGTPPTDAG